MHSTVVVLLSLFCTGWSKDVTLGNAEGRKIFDENRQASPAIWRQYENVTVIAPDNELISKVVITDMRPEKDGDAQIVNGGDGQKSVTIELKSPTVLRGYDFHIEVYSVPDTVATDAEEHLYNEAVTPVQSSESTELPDSAKDNHGDEPIQSSDSTELPDSANSKDIKDFPTLISDDSQADNTRPARETEENNSQIDVPEDEITSSYEISSASESTSESDKDTSPSQNEEKTTELPETPIDDSVVDPINPDNIRPARETELVTSEIDGAPPAIDSTEDEKNFATTEAGSETIMTDATTEVNDDVTTEVNDDATTTEAATITPYEQSTLTSISYYNSENVPNQPQPINILDYIKNREALRPIRHTEEEKHEENIGMSGLSVQTDENNDYTTPLADETSSMKPVDDTADLVPPEVNASFNSDFSGPETTVNPIEGTPLSNVPRAGRGIDFDSGNENTPTPVNTDEEFSTTTSPLNADVTIATLDEAHILASSDDQSRNIRGASKDLEDDSDVNISEEMPQGNVPNEEVVSSGDADVDQPNRNIIIINLDDLMARDENNKFAYALPIVLIIKSENNNYPIVKIIAEDASSNRDNSNSNELFPTLPSDTSLEPAEYEGMENDRIKGDTSSGDYDQSQ